MKWEYLVYGLMLMVTISSALSEEGGSLVRPDSGVVFEQTGTTFALVPALTSYTVNAKWIASAPNEVYNYYGSACKVGEYISLLICIDGSAKSCIRGDTKDYKKMSEADHMDITATRLLQGFQDATKNKYVGYECRVPKSSTPIVEQPSNVVAGQVLSWTVPERAEAGSTVRVKGQYKTLYTGPFVLEATIDASSSTKPLAVVTASKSACDGSVYSAGSRINGVAGTTYDFDFTFRAPSKTGQYFDVIVYSYTDCASAGGKQITASAQHITLTDHVVSPSSCGTVDTDGDGVKDGCDVCPTVKGDPTAIATGCHPCYGKLSSDSCWTTNAAKWGIPTNILNEQRIVVGTTLQCSGKTLNSCTTLMDFGKIKVECKLAEECTYQCSGKACVPAPTTPGKPDPVVPTYTYETGCAGDDIVEYQINSAGVKKVLKVVTTCSAGCDQGTCNKVAAKVKGGNENVNAANGDCTIDANCGLGLCEAGKCTEKGIPYQCTTDANCGATESCIAPGWCVAKNTTVKTTPESDDTCTANKIETCSDGSEVITDACSNGKLVPLGNRCSSSPQPNTPGPVIPDIPGVAGINSWYIIGGVVVVGGYFLYNSSKPHKRRRR
jgi:hypothetical protein